MLISELAWLLGLISVGEEAPKDWCELAIVSIYREVDRSIIMAV